MRFSLKLSGMMPENPGSQNTHLQNSSAEPSHGLLVHEGVMCWSKQQQA